MHVADLQAFLHSLLAPLVASDARKAVIDDLKNACDGLDPFKKLTVGEFATFLARAEEYDRTGIVPVAAKPAPRARSSTPKAPKITLEQAGDLVRSLYDRALDPDLTHETIEHEVKAIEALTAKDLEKLARDFGAAIIKPKAAAVNSIQEKISRRKSTHAGSQF